jgi:MIP family channel proteins
MNSRLAKQCVAEFIGTFALIFIGVGAIWTFNAGGDKNAGLLAVALAHGLTIAVMVSATGAISGGHLNPAVTFGLFIGKKISFQNTVAYWVAQLLGGTAAGLLQLGILGTKAVSDGTPDVNLNINPCVAIAVEIVLTFFLVFVVFGSAVDARAPKIGGLAIGLTVTLDILFGGPITGASMNPARTFGPALASGHWNNHYVYWVGPLIGGALAGLVYGRFLIHEDK